jgi:hypothetical protein
MMKFISPSANDFEPQETCRVVVIYEDVPTRQRALAACDFLTRQLWADIELAFQWWRVDFLTNAELASQAAETALTADFVILALEPDRQLSETLKSWFASWSERRSGMEGAMVDLTEARSAVTSLTTQREMELRQLARRAGLDYLTSLPASLSSTLPASYEAAGCRADQSSTVLEEILHQSPPPPHFGLND